MKTGYKILLVNIILFMAIFFTMDRALGYFLRHFYQTTRSGAIHHLNYSLDSTYADVIILGSGRAHSNYIPGIIEERLDLTCFNTGMDGTYIMNSYAVYKSLIHRYQPKIFIMDISTLHELFEGSDPYASLKWLLPYYKDKEELRGILLERSRYERIKLMSQIYPYNSKLLAIIKGNAKTEDISELKGFQPYHGFLTDTTMARSRQEEDRIDIDILSILETMAAECDSLQTKLVFVQSPTYALVDQDKGMILMKDLTDKFSCEFWNYATDERFLIAQYFRDPVHLNGNGAEEFTKEIAARLYASCDFSR